MAYFDPAYDESVRRIRENLAGLTSEAEQRKRRILEDYTQSKSKMGEEHETALSSLSERLANRGTLRSGVNVAEQGRLGRVLQENLGQLEQARTRGVEDIERDVTTRRGDYQSQLQSLELEKARRQTEWEQEQARNQAQAEANKRAADEQRQFLADLEARLVKMTQPQPMPTGESRIPPPISINMPAPGPSPSFPTAAPPSAAPPAPALKQLQPVAGPVQVDAVQTMLKQLGFNPGAVDNMVGPATMRAVNAFLTSQGYAPVNKLDQSVAILLQQAGAKWPTNPVQNTGGRVFGRIAAI